MQFLKILFWCLLAFVAALFTYGNWGPVPIHLWNGMEALVNLPLLLVLTFLLGFLPTLIYFSAIRWRLRQRIATCERQLSDLRALPPAPVPAAPVAVAPAPATPPPAAVEPIVTPPITMPPASDERPA